jgi:hypothetical protein
MRNLRTSAIALAAGALLSTPLAAQSAYRLSTQASFLSAALSGDAYEGYQPGGGFEAQLRYTTRKGWSFGGGYQATLHTLEGTSAGEADLLLHGAFFEPRYTFLLPNSDRISPYASGRLSLLRQNISVPEFDIEMTASGTTMNLGGGVLFAVGKSGRTLLDLGLTYGYTTFGEAQASAGGDSFPLEGGSGTNVIFRFGVSIGLK